MDFLADLSGKRNGQPNQGFLGAHKEESLSEQLTDTLMANCANASGP